MLTTLAVHGYRSLRDVVLPLAPLTVITGANGSGKSNLYRAFHLLADTANGRLIGALATAGGLSSVLWAGPEQITGAMRRGEVLTDRRTVTAGRLDGYGADRVLSVVRVTDPSVLALLRPGDTVDVLAVAGDDSLKARRVARSVPVVTLPARRSSFSDGAPVGLAVTTETALELAERGLDSRLSVVVAQSPG